MTDSDLRAFLDNFRADIKAQLADVTNKNLAAFETLKRTLDLHERHIARLWKQVRGSDPPTNEPASNPATTERPPLDEIAAEAHKLSSQNDLELSALESRMIVGFEKLNVDIAAVRGINEHQTKAMGLNQKGHVGLFTREGVKSVATIIAAITGLVTATGYAYAVAHGRPPLPTQVSP